MKPIIYFILMLIPCVAYTQDGAINKEIADSAYAKGDYKSAIEGYEAILANEGVASELYYNLGNAYYKTSEIGKAILNYERALLLDPSDSDIRFNLELARSKAVDKIDDSFQLFLVQWIEGLVNVASMGTWANIAVGSFVVMLVALLLLFFGKSVALRKSAMGCAIFMLLLTLFANYAAMSHYSNLTSKKMAIIMSPTVTAKSTPDDSGTSLFVIHEGRKVKVCDNSMKEWKEIELEDGTVGWVPANLLEVI